MAAPKRCDLTMDALSRLRQFCALAPAGTMVPVEALAAMVGAAEAAAETPADLTVQEVADQMGRKSGAVRGWIRSGELRAYLFNGKEYRVTRAALAEYIEAQRLGRKRSPSGAGKTADLGAWRQVRRGAA